MKRFKVGGKVKFSESCFDKAWKHVFPKAKKTDRGRVVSANGSGSYRIVWGRNSLNEPLPLHSDWLTKA